MVRDAWERPARHVDKSLAEDVDLDDETGDDDLDGTVPEPPPWPSGPPEPVAPPSRAHSCWSCAADVPSGAAACPECQESARHLRLISTRPPVDLRHGSCGPLNLGRHPAWAAPDVAAALDGEPGVSRRHASVEMTPDGGLWLTEHPAGTLNGTFVNGERVPPGGRVPVTDGDTVRLGRHCAFRVLVVEPPV
ncbi:FHA domain-containing protein [Streptomyces phaeoluteigriseus]|uniref:FHA domain-containing protein n=1 Tax=Streptomyces phaeoluteigriseus TaxID=114686 RepID=A0ABY4Z1K1_9ACTN|nr:FHA domain-containing protein [Streptomyces phaeoluteigriseus]USQ82929.1 FHA domain-containing protein [Streptomyces phaeoluteigriseus]